MVHTRRTTPIRHVLGVCSHELSAAALPVWSTVRRVQSAEQSDDTEDHTARQAPTAATGTASPFDALAREVAALDWHHAIDLGDGLVTPGIAEPPVGLIETFPDFRDRTVLDIGAWDGRYSFLAESRGARSVVALDHYVWGVDLRARKKYWQECKARGTLPDHSRDETDFWRDDLPGKRGFDLAHRALGSSVRSVVGDFMTIDLDALGTFDIVLYLGVLYHMKEPLTALERVRKVTREVAVIETEAMCTHVKEHEPLLKFSAGAEVASDYGNWYVPNAAGLNTLCRAAGFSHADTAVGYPLTTGRRRLRALRHRASRRPETDYYRIAMHAHA